MARDNGRARSRLYRRAHDGLRGGARRSAEPRPCRHCRCDWAFAGDLHAFYDLFAATERAVTVYSQGVNQSSAGTDKVNAIINCHLATGRIGKPGMGPFSVTGQPNAMGGREVGGLANMLAAHMEIENPEHRERRAGLLALAAHSGKARPEGGRHVPRRRGRPRQGDLDHGHQSGRLHAGRGRRGGGAPKACPFVVVSDVVARPTRCASRMSHCPHCLGREGRDGHQFRAAHLAPAGVPRQPRRSAPDWAIIAELAHRMGFGDAFAYETPAEIFAEYARCRPWRTTAHATSISAPSPRSARPTTMR